MACIHPWAPEAKVFWFFSSEKNTLYLIPALSVSAIVKLSLHFYRGGQLRVLRHLGKYARMFPAFAHCINEL